MADADDRGSSRVAPPSNLGEHYFWHAKVWSALTRDFTKLSHALLLHGTEGLGKSALALRLAKSLLCAAPTLETQACDRCPSCKRFDAGTHPDLKDVAPMGDSLVIGVDQIREVGEFCTLKPHTALRKVVIVRPADAMNSNAANAFLKVLEEPPSSSVFILISPRPTRLPATIRSRCMPVSFRLPRTTDAEAWLQARGVDEPTARLALRLAGGAPLRALAYAQSAELRDRDAWAKDVLALQTGAIDPLSCARKWKDYGAERCLDWFQRHVADLARARVGKDYAREKRISLKELFRYFDVLSDAKNLARGPLDEALLLEDISIRWSRLFNSVV